MQIVKANIFEKKMQHILLCRKKLVILHTDSVENKTLNNKEQ